jgi:hypothetical protein
MSAAIISLAKVRAERESAAAARNCQPEPEEKLSSIPSCSETSRRASGCRHCLGRRRHRGRAADERLLHRPRLPRHASGAGRLVNLRGDAGAMPSSGKARGSTNSPLRCKSMIAM